MGADEIAEAKPKTFSDLDGVFTPTVLEKLDAGYIIVEDPADGQLRLIAPSPLDPAA